MSRGKVILDFRNNMPVCNMYGIYVLHGLSSLVLSMATPTNIGHHSLDHVMTAAV